MRKKIVLGAILFIVFASLIFASTSAFDIQWWNQATYSPLPSNTLRQWAENMEGRVGYNLGIGKIFYVNSAVTNEGDGSSWTNARNTIDEAIDLCTASKGDVIYVAQGHAETIINATGLLLDKAGVTIIGIGTGSLRPKITFTTAAAATVSITAANCTFSGFDIYSNYTGGVTAAITISATGDGAVIDNCIFTEASVTEEQLTSISIATTTTDIVVKNCSFYNAAAGHQDSVILFVGSNTNCKIYNNTFFSDAETAVILGTTGAGTGLIIEANRFYLTDTGQLAASLKSDTTGLIIHNLAMPGAGTDDASAWSATVMGYFENYTTNTFVNSGRLDPAVDS
jgi:hypothetical protein